MTRVKALKILNPIMGLLVANQLITGFGGDSLPPRVFEFLHEGGGILLASAALLHIVLNWNWIKFTYFSRTAKSTGDSLPH